MPTPDVAGIHIATPVFDGAHEKDVFETLEIAGRPENGKTVLYDGRTGEPMDNHVTVGYVTCLNSITWLTTKSMLVPQVRTPLLHNNHWAVKLSSVANVSGKWKFGLSKHMAQLYTSRAINC